MSAMLECTLYYVIGTVILALVITLLQNKRIR